MLKRLRDYFNRLNYWKVRADEADFWAKFWERRFYDAQYADEMALSRERNLAYGRGYNDGLDDAGLRS
jgi:hypothetical protein